MFITIDTLTGLTFVESVNSIFDEYEKVLGELGLGGETEVLIRFFLSDITNQIVPLKDFVGSRNSSSFSSYIGQSPVDGSKISIMAYHIKAKKSIEKRVLEDNLLEVKHGDYTSLWIKNKPVDSLTSFDQSAEIFDSFSDRLQKNNGNIFDHTIRTWIYVRDIDLNYQGMVEARKAYFESVGLNPETHYITSTGIEALNEDFTHIVQFDALSVLGLKSEQLEYMEAPPHMCPTIKYGVTFERGVKVNFGDRAHYHISGTASIDHNGDILHIDDVRKQMERALENVDSLLCASGASIDDMQFFTVYLRDPADYSQILDVFNANYGNAAKIPINFVKGAVCRPKWLVEIEGIACTKVKNNFYSPFC